MNNLKTRISKKKSKYTFSKSRFRDGGSERVDWEFVGFPSSNFGVAAGGVNSNNQATLGKSNSNLGGQQRRQQNDCPVIFNYSSVGDVPPPVPPRGYKALPPRRPISLYSRLETPREAKANQRPRSNGHSPFNEEASGPSLPPHQNVFHITPSAPPVPPHRHASCVPQPLPLSPPAPPPPPHASPQPLYHEPDQVDVFHKPPASPHPYNQPASCHEDSSPPSSPLYSVPRRKSKPNTVQSNRGVPSGSPSQSQRPVANSRKSITSNNSSARSKSKVENPKNSFAKKQIAVKPQRKSELPKNDQIKQNDDVQNEPAKQNDVVQDELSNTKADASQENKEVQKANETIDDIDACDKLEEITEVPVQVQDADDDDDLPDYVNRNEIREIIEKLRAENDELKEEVQKLLASDNSDSIAHPEVNGTQDKCK